MATRIMASLVWVQSSASLDKRRSRAHPAQVRSTLHRFGRRRKPLVPAGRLTISRRTFRQGRSPHSQAARAPREAWAAHSRRRREQGCRRTSRTGLAPSGSGTLAAVTTTPRSSPRVSTKIGRWRPCTCWPASEPRPPLLPWSSPLGDRSRPPWAGGVCRRRPAHRPGAGHAAPATSRPGATGESQDRRSATAAGHAGTSAPTTRGAAARRWR